MSNPEGQPLEIVQPLRHEIANIAAGIFAAKDLAVELHGAESIAKLLLMCAARLESLMKRLETNTFETDRMPSDELRQSAYATVPCGQPIILVDDCEIARGTWKFALSRQGVPLVSYTSVEELLAEVDLPRTSPVFIDWNLTGGVSGLPAAEAVIAAGFSKVFITTGTPENCDISNSSVLGVVGKIPPIFQIDA